MVISSISLAAWVLLLFNPGRIMTIEHCHVSDAGLSATSFQMLLDMNPFSSQFAGWGLMVVAMMLPKLIFPIQYICKRSLQRKRLLLSTLFVIGYLAAWMAIGAVMIAAIMWLHLLLPNSYLPAIGVGIMAIIWQFSPAKQYCLNQGHKHFILALFGWPAMRDALHFGLVHGYWCVGAGWAIMLFPMLLPHGHNTAMIIVTFIMLSEHLEHPRMPGWRIDFRLRLFRILIAQSHIRLKQL